MDPFLIYQLPPVTSTTRMPLGPDIGTLKGKTTAVPPKTYPIVEVNQFKDVPQVLEIDLFYADRHLFLGSSSDPLDLVMVNYLTESASASLSPKQLDNVRSHLFSQIDAYTIDTVKCDSDAVLKSLAPELIREGIKSSLPRLGDTAFRSWTERSG